MGTFRTILFTTNRPLGVRHFARIFRVAPGGAIRVVSLLTRGLRGSSDNVGLLQLSGTCRLAAEDRCDRCVGGTFSVGHGAPLSPTTFRILTIITCGRPIAGSFVRRIENISYSDIIAALVRGKLVRRHNELRLPNGPLLCNAAGDFLEYFKLSSLGSLPALPGGRRSNRVGSINRRLALSDRRGR